MRGARPRSGEMANRVRSKEYESITYGPRPMIAVYQIRGLKSDVVDVVWSDWEFEVESLANIQCGSPKYANPFSALRASAEDNTT